MLQHFPQLWLWAVESWYNKMNEPWTQFSSAVFHIKMMFNWGIITCTVFTYGIVEPALLWSSDFIVLGCFLKFCTLFIVFLVLNLHSLPIRDEEASSIFSVSGSIVLYCTFWIIKTKHHYTTMTFSSKNNFFYLHLMIIKKSSFSLVYLKHQNKAVSVLSHTKSCSSCSTDTVQTHFVVMF